MEIFLQIRTRFLPLTLFFRYANCLSFNAVKLHIWWARDPHLIWKIADSYIRQVRRWVRLIWDLHFFISDRGDYKRAWRQSQLYMKQYKYSYSATHYCNRYWYFRRICLLTLQRINLLVKAISCTKEHVGQEILGILRKWRGKSKISTAEYCQCI
jgi:hypothetical protein